MRLYNRNGMLWVDKIVNGKRVRKSTKLKYSQDNIRLFKSYSKNDKFFNKFNVNVDVPTVVELCEEVLREKQNTLKSTSYRSYESLFNNRIVPYFDKKLISEIEPIDIEDWYKTFDDRSTLTTSEAILKKAIEKSLIRKYIKQSPLVVSKPSFTSKYKMNPFSFDEIQIILKNCIDNWFRNFIAINFFTGLRTGEMIGLKWSDINFEEYSINVQRTITHGWTQTPKTKSSLREIDMIPQCEEYLKLQRKITGLGEYVFVDDNKKTFYGSSTLHPRWEKVLIKSNLKFRGIYQLRHSFASNMLSNKEEPLWVSTMLGHKDASVTLQKYAKYIKKERVRKTTFLDDIGTKMAQN